MKSEVRGDVRRISSLTWNKHDITYLYAMSCLFIRGQFSSGTKVTSYFSTSLLTKVNLLLDIVFDHNVGVAVVSGGVPCPPPCSVTYVWVSTCPSPLKEEEISPCQYLYTENPDDYLRMTNDMSTDRMHNNNWNHNKPVREWLYLEVHYTIWSEPSVICLDQRVR